MQDTFNREIDYARISITDKCNLFCQYCKPDQDDDLYHQFKIDEVKILIKVLNDLNFRKIRFTGGEPLIFDNLVEIIKYANKMSNIEDIGITTNAVLLDKYLDDLIAAGLKRVNVSLDTLDRNKFFDITKVDVFNKVYKNIILAKEKGLKVKVNVVLMKDVNDIEVNEFIEFGKKYDIQIRFIELMPIGGNDEYIKDKQEQANLIIDQSKFKEVASDKRDVADYFVDEDGYKLGIITPMSNHFCNKCNRIRFTSEGNLRMCLHDDDEFDLKPYLNNEDELKNILKQLILDKPEKHHLNENKETRKGMSKIGG